MLRRLIGILVLFLAFVLLFALQKPIFAIVVGGYTFVQLCTVIWHGLPMDASIAAYLTAIPWLLVIVSIYLPGKWLKHVLLAYAAVISLLMSMSCISNAALYPYWGFPLDCTPLFYFTTSPSAAMASITTWQMAGGLVAIAGLALIYFLCLRLIINQCFSITHQQKRAQRIKSIGLLALEGLGLFLAIRGGITVSSMNLSRVYFSDNVRLNHAAVNPLFSLMYSATHQTPDIGQFDFFPDEQAACIFASLEATDTTVYPRLNYPDIHLIIAESFSANLMPSFGGEPIATRIDSISQDSWSFNNAYSSSFRTDRALTAILCAYPALPTTSLMKYVDKIDHIPSLPRTLKDAGYDMHYYYGGDINFTNLNALLATSGFDKVKSDKDFPLSQKLSKWGVPDHVLFENAIADSIHKNGKPAFVVLQTSSSHEPFDIPASFHKSDNPRINAFMYADSVIANYLEHLKSLPNYDNTLAIIVADHYGAYPEELEDPQKRHRIPLIMTGGAIKGLPIDTALLQLPAGQTDIAATLLSLLGIDYRQFKFSNNLLNPQRKPYAFFSEPTYTAFMTADSLSIIDVGSERVAKSNDIVDLQKAYLQVLYKDFIEK